MHRSQGGLPGSPELYLHPGVSRSQDVDIKTPTVLRRSKVSIIIFADDDQEVMVFSLKMFQIAGSCNWLCLNLALDHQTAADGKSKHQRRLR